MQRALVQKFGRIGRVRIAADAGVHSFGQIRDQASKFVGLAMKGQRRHRRAAGLAELERTGGRYGLQTMCEGGGQANVTILERL